MKKKTDKTAIDWREKFIELIVVVIGITIAFLINRGYENYKNQHTEIQYLNSMHEDLEADVSQLDSVLQNMKTQNMAIGHLIRIIPGKRFQEDSLLHLIQSVTTLYFFTPQQTTFYALKNSGDLHLITDYKLRHDILNYYQELESLDYLHRITTEYFNRYIVPIVINRLDLSRQKFSDRSFMHSAKFLNIVLGFRSLLLQQKELYQKLRSRALKILRELPSESNR